MEIKLRSGTTADAEPCGRICYEAFKTISEAHGFAPDFPVPEVAIAVLNRMLTNPKFYSVIAELDGHIVGSNFLDERKRLCDRSRTRWTSHRLCHCRRLFRSRCR